MTHQYAKSIRKKLRELAGLAPERELSRAYDDDLLVYKVVKLGFLSREEVQEKVAEAILTFHRLILNKTLAFLKDIV